MALADSPKAQALHQLAALFTTAAANARCSHAVWVTGEGFQQVANDTQPPSAWGELPLGGARSFEEAHGLLPRVCGGRESVLSLAISFGPATPCPPAQAHRRRRRRDPRAIARAIRPRTAQTRQRAVGRQRTGETLSLYIDTTIQEQYRKTLQRLQQSWDHAAQQTEPNSSPSLPTTSRLSAQP